MMKSYDISSHHLKMTAGLTDEQTKVLEAVIARKNIFMTGSPGTGKSYTLKIIIKHLKQSGIKFAITASTGCSAVLVNGQTIHSYLGMGIGSVNIDRIVANLKSKKTKMKQLQELQCLIIDEISMIDDDTFMNISKILCKIRGDVTPLGGVQTVLVGDFCQLLPVRGHYAFMCDLWKEMNLECIQLTKLIRQQHDEEFQKILQQIRFGKCTKTTFQKLLALKDTTFPSNIVPTKLYSLNSDVEAINQHEFRKLYKKNTSLLLKDAKIIQCIPSTNDIDLDIDFKISCDTDKDVFRYYAFSSDKTIKTDDYQIDLIKGLQIMITRNINFDTGLINGTIGTIISLNTYSICIMDTYQTKHVIYYHIDVNENNNTYIKFMPIKLAYALSIHKSQGATLDAIEVDGSTYIFAPGQLYTALSRGKNLSSIRLVNLDKDSFMCHKAVKEFYASLSCV